MGYIHDVNMVAVLGPELCQIADTQAWTDAVASDVWSKDRAAGATTFNLKIPVLLPQNSTANLGAYLKTIELFWVVGTAALTSLAAAIFKATLPANGAAFAAPASQAFTYDTGHDTAGERLTQDEHAMTLTITTPFWVQNTDLVYCVITAEAGANPVFKYYGARMTYTLRL